MADDPFAAVASLQRLREELATRQAPVAAQGYAQPSTGQLRQLSGQPQPYQTVSQARADSPRGQRSAWMKKAGLSPAEQWIIMKESSGDPLAQNSHSTAFGLWQGLASTRKQYLGANWQTTDPTLQLGAFRRYVKDRYTTPENAVAHHKANGYY